MNRRCKNGVFLFAAVAIPVSIILTGCAQPVTKPAAVICPPRQTVDAALAVLDKHRGSIVPIRAGVHGIIQLSQASGKTEKETFVANLVYYPPDRIFFKGDKFGEIRFGTNADEFWLQIKPDISTCWWGKAEQAQNCPDNLLLNPYNIIESLGFIRLDGRWTLSGGPAFDVLTSNAFAGGVTKKIYLDRCDDLVRRIEYINTAGTTIVIDMDNYIRIANGPTVPTSIDISNSGPDNTNSTVHITLKGPKLLEKKPKAKLFKRPPFTGYENIYTLTDDCTWVKQ